MIFNLVGLQAQQTGSSTQTKVLLRAMLLHTTIHQDALIKQALRMGIRDDQWDRIKDMLPGRAGHVGVTARNNRLFIDAVLYRYRTGIPWRDLPEKYGDFRNVHRRFSRWAEKGIWAKLLSVLSQEADTEYVLIDSTVVRAHQHSAGGRDPNQQAGHGVDYRSML
jgi:transposase